MFIDVVLFSRVLVSFDEGGARKTTKDAPRLRLTGQHLALVFGALPPAVMPFMFCKYDWGPGGHFRPIISHHLIAFGDVF